MDSMLYMGCDSYIYMIWLDEYLKVCEDIEYMDALNVVAIHVHIIIYIYTLQLDEYLVNFVGVGVGYMHTMEVVALYVHSSIYMQYRARRVHHEVCEVIKACYVCSTNPVSVHLHHKYAYIPPMLM